MLGELLESVSQEPSAPEQSPDSLVKSAKAKLERGQQLQYERHTLMISAKISCRVVIILANATIIMIMPVTPILFLMGGLSESEVGGV